MADIFMELLKGIMQAEDNFYIANKKAMYDKTAWEWVNQHHPDASEEQKAEYYEAFLGGILNGFPRGMAKAKKDLWHNEPIPEEYLDSLVLVFEPDKRAMHLATYIGNGTWFNSDIGFEEYKNFQWLLIQDIIKSE